MRRETTCPHRADRTSRDDSTLSCGATEGAKTPRTDDFIRSASNLEMDPELPRPGALPPAENVLHQPFSLLLEVAATPELRPASALLFVTGRSDLSRQLQ